MNHPNAFLNTPSYGATHPGATPIQQVQEGRVPYVRPGLANTEPVLSVAYPNTLTLTRPLLAKLDLSKMATRRVHLVVPTQRGGQWYLDTNPKPGMGAHLPVRGCCRFRIQYIPKIHFAQSRPLFAASPDWRGPIIKGNANVFVSLLHFRLGAPVEGHEGYYHLDRLTGPVH